MSNKSDKLWADELRKAVNRYSDQDDPENKGKKLKWFSVLANKVVKKAVEGDMVAAKEIGDRIDGKPKQVVGGDIESPLTVVIATGIQRDGDD